MANHEFVFGAPPSVEAAARACGDAASSFSRHPRLQAEGDPVLLDLGRPLGVQLLVAGCDPPRRRPGVGPAPPPVRASASSFSGGGAAAAPLLPSGALYSVAPTGAVARWRAKAVGSGAADADRFLARWLQRRANAWPLPTDDDAATSLHPAASNAALGESLAFAPAAAPSEAAAASEAAEESPSPWAVAAAEEAAASAAARRRAGARPPSEREACRAAVAAVLRSLRAEDYSDADDDDEAHDEAAANQSTADAAPNHEAAAAAARQQRGWLDLAHPALTAADAARVEVAVARPSGFRVLRPSEVVALLGLGE